VVTATAGYGSLLCSIVDDGVAFTWTVTQASSYSFAYVVSPVSSNEFAPDLAVRTTFRAPAGVVSAYRNIHSSRHVPVDTNTVPLVAHRARLHRHRTLDGVYPADTLSWSDTSGPSVAPAFWVKA